MAYFLKKNQLSSVVDIVGRLMVVVPICTIGHWSKYLIPECLRIISKRCSPQWWQFGPAAAGKLSTLQQLPIL